MHISELAQHHVENPREIVAARATRSGEDPRDRLRAPPPVAVDQARGGPDPAAPRAARPRRGDAGDLDDVPDLGLSEDVVRRGGRPPARATTRAEAEARPRPPPRRRRRGRRRPRLAAEAEPTSSRGRGPRSPRPAAEPEAVEAAGRRGRGRPPSPSRRGRGPPEPAEARVTQRPPFVGLTGGIGAGKSEALAALGAPGRRDALDRRGRPRALRERRAARRRRGALGPEVAPGGVVDRAAVARRAFADDEERALAGGPLWPRVGARVAEWREEESARDPPPPALVVEVAAAVRVRAWSRRSTRRSRSSPTRASAPSAPAPAATRRSTSAPRASSRRRRRPQRADLRRPQRRHRSRSWSGTVAVLAKLSEHLSTRTPPAASPGAPRRARPAPSAPPSRAWRRGRWRVRRCSSCRLGRARGPRGHAAAAATTTSSASRRGTRTSIRR